MIFFCHSNVEVFDAPSTDMKRWQTSVIVQAKWLKSPHFAHTHKKCVLFIHHKQKCKSIKFSILLQRFFAFPSFKPHSFATHFRKQIYDIIWASARSLFFCSRSVVLCQTQITHFEWTAFWCGFSPFTLLSFTVFWFSLFFILTLFYFILSPLNPVLCVLFESLRARTCKIPLGVAMLSCGWPIDTHVLNVHTHARNALDGWRKLLKSLRLFYRSAIRATQNAWSTPLNFLWH